MDAFKVDLAKTLQFLRSISEKLDFGIKFLIGTSLRSHIDFLISPFLTRNVLTLTKISAMTDLMIVLISDSGINTALHQLPMSLNPD